MFAAETADLVTRQDFHCDSLPHQLLLDVVKVCGFSHAARSVTNKLETLQKHYVPVLETSYPDKIYPVVMPVSYSAAIAQLKQFCTILTKYFNKILTSTGLCQAAIYEDTENKPEQYAKLIKF